MNLPQSMLTHFNPVAMAVALLVALALDRWRGEPPERWHPVVWMGHYLRVAGNWLQRGVAQPGVRDLGSFWRGAIAWYGGVAIVCIAYAALGWAGLKLPAGLGALAQAMVAGVLLGWLLKPMLAWALLKDEVLAVERALDEQVGGSLAQGRQRLRWLVSRDVSALTSVQVRESAIETLAENLNDAVIAPIFWFVLLGLPGAALYRFANTADAMWGYPGVYQGQHWEWAGKWAARADDILSWVPARLTGALLWAVVACQRGPAPRFGLAVLRQQARQTPSPNSGWPMAAMALALNVSLAKPGVYTLNASGRAAQPLDTALAVAYASKVLLVQVVSVLVALICVAICLRGGA